MRKLKCILRTKQKTVTVEIFATYEISNIYIERETEREKERERERERERESILTQTKVSACNRMRRNPPVPRALKMPNTGSHTPPKYYFMGNGLLHT